MIRRTLYVVLNTTCHSIDILKIGKNNKSADFIKMIKFSYIQTRSHRGHVYIFKKQPTLQNHPISSIHTSTPNFHCQIAQKISIPLRYQVRQTTSHLSQPIIKPSTKLILYKLHKISKTIPIPTSKTYFLPYL